MKIKIYLDYKCFPVWVYDADGSLIDNDLPKELLEDKELDEYFLRIQAIYDELFIDNSVEFKFVGFENEIDKVEFLKMIDIAVKMLSSRLGDSYVIENKISL